MVANLRRKILIAFISFVCSLMIVEIILRVFYPQKLAYNVTQWDAHVGFVNMPNANGFVQTSDFKTFVRINSHGLRDREFDYRKPPGTMRIGVFGDSFTFGYGVENHETYPKLLEALIRNRPGPLGTEVEVLNFGIGKTGTSHQLAFYQTEGRKYHLDLVILAFLAANDFVDNWGGVYYLRDSKLIHFTTPYSPVRKLQRIVYRIPFYRQLIAHSHLLNLLRKTATLYDDQKRTETTAALNQPAEKNDIGKKRFYLTVRLIEEFAKEAARHDSEFLVLNLPAKGQRVLAAPAQKNLSSPWMRPHDGLIDELNLRGIKVLDLVPVFSSLSKEKYYFEQDAHMTRKGHEIIASSIYQALRQSF